MFARISVAKSEAKGYPRIFMIFFSVPWRTANFARLCNSCRYFEDDF
jgi:hypothetical protein